MDYIIVPIIWIVLIILLIAFIASNIVIVPQAKAYVIERLGTYRRVFPDHRPEAVCIRYRKPDGGNRKSDCNHTAKHHR